MDMLVVAAAMAVVSCSGGAEEAPGQENVGQGGDFSGAPETPAPECWSDQDCADGMGCSPEGGVCVPLAVEGQVFSVAVDPVEDTVITGAGTVIPLVPDQFRGVEVGAGGRIDLTLSVPVEVHGVVVMGGEGPAEISTVPGGVPGASILLSGRLVATAPGLVPGTSFRSETTVGADLLSGAGPADEDAATYTGLYLLPGITYDILFLPDERPSDPELPVLPAFKTSASFSADGRLDVVLPARERYIASTVEGVVLAGDAADEPLVGVLVTGKMGGLQGTSSVTDKNGVFRVVLPPGQGNVLLRVTGLDPEHPVPSREFVFDGGLADILGLGTPTLEMGRIPPARDVILQVFHVADGSLVPVPGALVRAVGDLEGGRVEGTSVTDDDGLARLRLLEAVYSLVVVPGPDTRFASRAATLDLVSNPGDEVFNVPLESRNEIVGRVERRTSGEGVKGAVVTLQTVRVDAVDDVQAGMVDIGFDAITGDDGSFRMWVDSGVYAITVVPPAWSGLARFSQPSVVISGDSSITIPLPDGRLVRGRVKAAAGKDDWAAIPGAKVGFFFEAVQGDGTSVDVQDLGPVGGTSFSATAMNAGTAVAADDGSYSVVLAGTAGGEYDGGASPGFGLPAVEVVSMSERGE